MSDVRYQITSTNRDATITSAKTFAIAKGTSLADVSSQFAAFAKTNGIESNLSLTSTGASKIANDDIGTNRGVAAITLGTGSVDVLRLTVGMTISAGTDMTVQVNGNTLASADVDGSKINITAASGLKLKNAVGLSVKVTDGTSSTTSDGSLTIGGGSLKFQIGANSGEQTEVQIDGMSTQSIGQGAVTGKTLADLDVTTAQGATDALAIIDKAISDVSNTRAKLGAFQSQVLESNVRSLGVAKENLTASESTIRDTDMASEMVQFTKNNILSQASQAMLSQANNSSQGILQLLRG
jgi:flagellin